MKAVVDEFIQQKNKVGEKITPIYLYAIQYDELANAWLRYSGAGIDVTFDGYLYKKYAITHSTIGENLSGKIDKVTLSISNITREMQYYLNTYNNLRKCKVTIKLAWLENLDNPFCFIEDTYSIEDCHSTPKQVDFTLASDLDVLDIQIPRRAFFRAYCRFIFKGTECGYIGVANWCNKTYDRCKELSNIRRFGGFPGIPMSRILVK
jgi:lambda family phage minor tail protein L